MSSISPELLEQMKWRKANACQYDNGCVELARAEGHVAIRDTKSPDAPALIFSDDEWCKFTVGLVAGEFDYVD